MTQENQTENSVSELAPGPASGSRWRGWIKPVLGVVALLAVILWSVGVFSTRTPPGVVEHQDGLPLPENAALFTVKQEQVAPRVDVVGTVLSETKADISSRIPGYIKEVFVSAGDTVKVGQKLITIDDREISEQVAAAEAQFKQAEAELNRTSQLFSNKATTEQAMTAAQSMFATAKAQLERSRIMQTYAQITSPMNGLVTDCRVVAGDLANPGQVLLAVYDPANMQLEVPVPVRLLGRLAVGQKVDVTLDRPAGMIQGTVRKVVSEVDPLSRTQLVKVHLEAPSPEILPGTFGRLWVADDARKTIMIPATAVYSVGQIEMVQVARDRRAVVRAVRTGQKLRDTVEILSGLDTGDVVLVNPVKEN